MGKYWYEDYKDPVFDNKFVVINNELCEVYVKYFHDSKSRLKSYYYYKLYKSDKELKRYYPKTKHYSSRPMRIKRAKKLFPEEFL
ncbi:MAG: hypothetical protein KAI79_09205 [Bacteroidales bacterium]|nr:hypothetical protein [Bacteroidales bacterium]